MAFFFVYELLDTEIRTILYKFFIYLKVHILDIISDKIYNIYKGGLPI